MSLDDKGIVEALRMPFDYIFGVINSLFNIFVGLILLPFNMIEALFS